MRLVERVRVVRVVVKLVVKMVMRVAFATEKEKKNIPNLFSAQFSLLFFCISFILFSLLQFFVSSKFSIK